ncbi:hypothetical protein B1H10_00915 [candidate division KSB1 bacterium 4484_188]|nr:MAG: hypothetical protein B1H10_00915 [candidate division KSB1 bacterium 4484_188]
MKKKKKKRKRSISRYTGSQAKPQNRTAVQTISLCMIVKNEEKFLPGCLESVQNLVDEIVIVDTGSTDKTQDIARKFDAKLYNFKWRNDFAEARNYALERCSSSWILYLDADERLPEKYHTLLREQISLNDAEALYLKVYSSVSGILGNVPHIQAYPRLFRKIPGAQFEGKIHEQITPSLKRLNARFKYVDATIEHLGYAQDDYVLKQKIERNLALLADQIQKEPRNAYAHFQMGQTLLLNQKIEEGKLYLLKALNFHSLPSNLTSTALLMLANEYFKDEDYDIALGHIEKAIQLSPRQRLGYFLQSECYAKQHHWKEAIEALQKVQQYSDTPFSDISIEKTFDAYLLSQRMGLYWFHLGNHSRAMESFWDYFRQARSVRFSFLEKWVHAWQELGSPAEEANKIIGYFRNKPDAFDEEIAAAKMLAGVAEKVQQSESMADYLKFCLNKNPHDATSLYYLGNIALERNDVTTAVNYYQKALQIEQNVWEIYYNYAVTQIKLMDFAAAIRTLEKAVQRFPEKEPTVKRLITGLYAKLGIYDKVMENLSESIEAG